MRVLVTGGTGYLGRAIVRALAAHGHEVAVFARHASRAALTPHAVDGDVRDASALARAARGCDAICHSAALVSIWRRNPREFWDVNVGGLEHAIAAARAASVPRLIYTSSFLARPPAGRDAPLAANEYQRSKADARRTAQRAIEHGAPIVMLVPGVIYGPGVRTEGNLVGNLLTDHAARRLPGIVGADRVWAFTWIEDVAQAHAAALERGAIGTAYALGGENAPQVRAFEIAREVLGLPLPRRLPAWAAALAGALDERRARWTGRPPVLTRRTVEIFRHDWPLDSADAVRDLGYRPSALKERLVGVLEGLGV